MRGFRGSLSTVLVSDDVLGVEEPTWREVHPGVTVRQVDDESVVVWARPYPGHPGGFVVQDHIRQDVDRYARALSDLFDLFDSEAIACHEFDLPHVEAFPYLVRVVDLATRVLVQRLPGELEDYLEHPEDDAHPRRSPPTPRCTMVCRSRYCRGRKRWPCSTRISGTVPLRGSESPRRHVCP